MAISVRLTCIRWTQVLINSASSLDASDPMCRRTALRITASTFAAGTRVHRGRHQDVGHRGAPDALTAYILSLNNLGERMATADIALDRLQSPVRPYAGEAIGSEVPEALPSQGRCIPAWNRRRPDAMSQWWNCAKPLITAITDRDNAPRRPPLRRQHFRRRKWETPHIAPGPGIFLGPGGNFCRSD
jgi:hypothetical protein